ncbi:hypothetical protein EDD15DRAFT_2375503 [Pisolithus albus]|nr:hypothetical protein EDD15DRAFT_2375503 [Pisolithus albus]
MAFLPLQLERGSKIDVVEEYHCRNHFPCALDPQQLYDVQQRWPASSSAPLQRDALLDEPSSAPSEIEGPISGKTSAPSGELSGPATKLRSYPYKFHEIIEQAKQLAQCGAASDPFPTRAWFVHVLNCFTALGALMTWWSTLKAKARKYVMRHYWLGGDRLAKENLANAQELIRGAKFVRDGTKEDGTTRNMASPALAGLILDFFHTGPSALGSLFPEVFAWEVPKPVMCLAATVLHATIDEYAIMGIWKDCQFESSAYLKVFMQLMAMQAKIDGNHKHAMMTRALRIGWATSGR